MLSNVSEKLPSLNGEFLIFVLFLVSVGLYVIFLPSFEGPDETEHSRYIQGYTEGAEIHPVNIQEPLKWGFQVHHPPLYYRLMGYYSMIVQPTFHGSLIINPYQNFRFPFIRHDLPGHKFPFDDVNWGIRLLRLPSVFFGITTFWILNFSFKRILPNNHSARFFFLTVSMLAPNTLQIFSTVGNDGLNFLFSTCLLFFTLKIIQEDDSKANVFFYAGLFAGLTILTKLTGLIAIATAGTVWVIDAFFNRRLQLYVKRLPWFLIPIFVIAGPYFVLNVIWYGDPTREALLRALTPAFYFENTRSTLYLLPIMLKQLSSKFIADLCYQSVSLDYISPFLFWPWLVGSILPVAFVRKSQSERRVESIRLISFVAIFWSTVFLVLANRNWTNLQIRHLWCVYPFTFLGLLFVLDSCRVGYKKLPSIICAGILFLLIGLNFLILGKFQDFYRPSPNTSDRDYYTFFYKYIKNTSDGEKYLLHGK